MSYNRIVQYSELFFEQICENISRHVRTFKMYKYYTNIIMN